MDTVFGAQVQVPKRARIGRITHALDASQISATRCGTYSQATARGNHRCEMGDFMEIINAKTMTGKLLENGEVIAEYKIEQCDKCSILVRFDAFGYQKGYGDDKIIWFCKDCR